MSIEQAESFMFRLSRNGEIPTGLAMAVGVLFDAVEEQASEIKAARKEIDALKARIQQMNDAEPVDSATIESRFLTNIGGHGLGLGSKF